MAIEMVHMINHITRFVAGACISHKRNVANTLKNGSYDNTIALCCLLDAWGDGHFFACKHMDLCFIDIKST